MKGKSSKTYIDKVHTWGTIFNVSALFVMLGLPLAMSIYWNAWPAASGVFRALLSVLPMFWLTAVIEVVTYTPLLGAGGTYLSFVTGNISNLKLPCGLQAMDTAGVRANSEEGEVISTIAIASSAITTTVILAVGVLAFSPILPSLTAEDSFFAPAFKNVTSALFGALGASYFAKHWKISILPILTGVVVLWLAPSLGVSVLLFITVIVSLLGAYFMYKKGIV